MDVAAAVAAPVAAPTQSNETSVADNGQIKGGQNLSETVKAKSPLPTAAEMFDMMVNGKQEKWPKEKVLAYASKGHVADKKFEEASQLRKENEKLREMAKKDPIAALLDPSLGLNKDQLREAIESYYNREYIEPTTLTEEQRELNRYREDEKQRKETQKQEEERQAQEAQEKLSGQHREVLQKQIISALEASGLPKTAFYASRMAFHMSQNLKNGWDAPQDLIIDAVKNEHNSIFNQMAALPAEEIIKVMGDEFVNKIRAYDLQKLREGRSKLAPSFSGKEPIPMQSKDGKIDMTEVNERFRRMKRDGF